MVARTLPQDSPGDSADTGASANNTTIAIQDGAAHVPAGIELAHADFDRDGSNLVIETGNGDTFTVKGYFNSDSKPVIEGTDGVALTPAMVTTLAQAGKGLFLAQAQMGRDITPGSEPIGKIVTAKGTVTVQHADGTTDTLQAGDPVYIYDVVITGADSELAIAFTDESVLSLSEDARMTLDRYIYNPDGAESNMLVGLLQGTLAVVSGQIAPEGDMEVSTPVATLGIRGTSAVIQLQDVNLRVALVTDVQDGQGGLIQIYNNTTNDLLITLTENEIGLIASLFAGSSDATLTDLTPEERALITQTVSALTSSYNQSQGNQGPNATPGSGTGDPNGINTDDLNGDGNGDGNGNDDGSSGGDENDGGEGDDSAVLPGPQLALPTIPTILEDTPTVISGISVSGPSSVTMTIVANGTFQLASIAQLTFLTVDGVAVTPGDVIFSNQEFTSVSFSGPIAAVRAALDGLVFTPDPDVNDLNTPNDTSGLLSFTAVGNGQTDTGDLGINVTAVNDTPILTAPTNVTTLEDTVYNFTGLSVSDPVEDIDIDETGSADPIKVTLVVDGASGEFVGTLGFSGSTSVNFTGGDADGSDGTLEFTGSRAEVNDALAKLQFTPDQDFNDDIGSAKLTITVNDQGNSGVDPGTSGDASSEEDISVVDISVTPVNDAPVIDTSSAGVQGAVFGGALGDGILMNPVSNIPTGGDFSITLAIKDAAQDHTTGSIPGEAYVSYAIGGAAQDNDLLIVNNYTTGLHVWIANNEVIVGNVIPQDGDWHHLAVTFDSAAGTIDVYIDGALVADDVGAIPSGETLTGGGSLYLGQEQDSVGGSLDANQALVGSLAEVGFWDGQLTATEIENIASNNFDPTDAEIFLSWNDSTTSFDDVSGGGNTPTTVGNVTTDADVIVTAVEDTPLNLSGITVSDVDVGTDPLNVTLTVSNGTLDFSGTDISGTLSGSGFSTVDVQSDAVAATPGSITTTGFSATTVDPGEPATLVGSTYSDIDFTNGGSDDGEISFEIEADFDGPNFVTIGFSDVDGNVSNNASVTITEFVAILNDKLNDALSSTGETYATINGSGGIDISTLSADINSQIQISTFTETNGATGSGLGNGFDTGEDPDYITFELSVDSGANQTITIDNAAVTAVGNNDGVIDDAAEFAAVLNSLMTGATATDNGLGEVTIASDTTGTSSTIDISLYTASTSGGSTGLTDGTGTSGTDAVPTSISFDLDIDGTGPVSITIDEAKVNAYNIAYSTSLVALALSVQDIADLINDQAGTDVASVSGGELVFTSDIVGTDSSVEISGFAEALSSGTLGLTDGSDAGSGPNLTDISGEGTDTFSFSGTQSDINAILNGLIGYTPDQDFDGTDTLNIAVDDGGASGLGGTLSDSESVDINVLPVNDAPAIDVSAIADGANLLVNGGFEADAAASGVTTLTGWSVTGDIDIIDPSWGPAEGTKSIDLHGTAPGVISQSFATEIGEVYTVSFQLAGYLAAGETINDVRVSAAGVSEDFSFDKTGALTVNDIQWETKTFSFVATSTTTTIEFSSLDAISGAGPVIDDVQAFETGAGAVTGEPLVISGIAISDVDASSDPLTVTLSLSGAGTLDFTTGTNTSALTGISGQGTGTLTFSGSQADVTAALASSIEYTSGSGFEGTETLQIDVDDGGSSGSGGAQIDSETIEITVVSYPSSALGIWLFDDTSDSSGNSRDLTLNGASLPTITSNGLIGNGIELDGSFGSSATVNSNNAVFDFGADDFTVQVWVNLDTFNTSEGPGSGYGEQVLVEKLDGDGSPGDPGWTLTYFGDSILFGGNYDSGTPFGFQAATDPNLAIDQWQQFVVTRSDDTFKIYQNGQLIGTFTSTETIGTSSNPLHIGARNGGDGRNFTVDGTIDNVVIYDGAWTANDVIEQWNGGAGNDIFPGNPTNAPVIHAGSTLAYTENDPATAIDTTVYVFDADDTHIESATVEITGNFVQGQDVLAFVDTANITGTYNPTTGILSLTGSDTLANYQAALRSVTYENSSDDPDSSARTVSFTINDGDTDSIPATSTINVTPTNDTPVAVDDTVLTNQGIGDTLYIPASILLSNDTDADGDNLAVTGAAGTGATFNSGTDEVEYVLASSLSSPETFTYDIEDPSGSADTATVSVERGTSTNANEVTGTSADEFLIGSDIADVLTGNGGNDFFGGLDGDDTIIGGSGKDSILGGKGADTITGGTDADLFVWHDGDANGIDVDTITDFNLAEDTLDLAGLLDSAFDPNTNTSSYVQAVTNGTDTTVSVDFDGAGTTYNFVDVVVLENISGGNITFVYDDASSTTTVTVV